MRSISSRLKKKQYAGYEVADLLNELSEENAKMKGEIIKLGVKWRVLSQKNDLLRYENEQLKNRLNENI